jgi:hypothetical protein
MSFVYTQTNSLLSNKVRVTIQAFDPGARQQASENEKREWKREFGIFHPPAGG